MLVAPASRPLRARNHHLLTSSITYSCSASQDPEQPTFPVHAAGEQHGARVDGVPAGTGERHDRRDDAAPTSRRSSTQSVRPSARRATLSRRPTASGTASTRSSVAAAPCGRTPRYLGCRGRSPRDRGIPADPRPPPGLTSGPTPAGHARPRHPPPNRSCSWHRASWPPSTCSRRASSACSRPWPTHPTDLDALAARTGLDPARRADQRRRHGGARPARARRRHATATARPPAGSSPGARRPTCARCCGSGTGSATRPGPTLPGRSAAGRRHRSSSSTTSNRRSSSAGIEAVLAGPAAALPHVVDLAAHRRLLDVGGGTGPGRSPLRGLPARCAPPCSTCRSWRRSRAGGSPGPGWTAGSSRRRRRDGRGPAERARRVPGREPRALLVARAEPAAAAPHSRAAAPPARRLLLADFWTDPTHTRPVHAALMAGEFAVHLEHGDVYSVDEVRDWLARHRLAVRRAPPLAGPQSLVVAATDQQ